MQGTVHAKRLQDYRASDVLVRGDRIPRHITEYANDSMAALRDIATVKDLYRKQKFEGALVKLCVHACAPAPAAAAARHRTISHRVARSSAFVQNKPNSCFASEREIERSSSGALKHPKATAMHV